MKVLITGAAGFVGNAVAMHLLERGDQVVGLDTITDYYDVSLKHDRLKRLEDSENWRFIQMACEDRDGMANLFASEGFDRVIHLAAQAGVRYSLENPYAYIDSNLAGFITILEGCRHHNVEHLVYASSSSVYGLNRRMPFAVSDSVDHPVSLYAATKKANELMAHSYSHLYGIPTTGLRFFTVYGPWGRPDMAYFSFTKKILAGEPIQVFNHGKMQRDFTYIDDIVEGVIRLVDRIPQPDTSWDPEAPCPGSSPAPYRVSNIGNHQPIELEHFITVIEKALGVPAKRDYQPMQSGDVLATAADVSDLMRDVDFAPNTSIEDGIARFVTWYRSYYGV